MRRVVGMVAVALAIVSVLAGGSVGVDVAVDPATANAATTSTPLTVTSPRDVAVDPASGRVFVSGGDAIDVFGPDGARLTTVTGVPGAGGLDIAGTSLWATTGASSLVEIDLTTLSIVRSVPTGLPVEPQLVVVGTSAFARMDNPFAPGADAVLAVDLVTGAWRGIPGFNELDVLRADDVTDRVYVIGGFRLNPHTVRAISTTPPYGVVAEWSTGSLGAVQVSADGGLLWAVDDQNGGAVHERNLATGAITAAGGYPTVAGTATIASTPARGGLIAMLSTSEVAFAPVGTARGAGRLALPTTEPGLAAFSPDGLALWRVTPTTLQRLTFVPSVSGVSPSSVVSGRGERVTVTGPLLGGASSVTVAGVPATVRSSTGTSVGFDLPAGVPAGVHPVVIGHPFGAVATTVTVTPPLGYLSGEVRVGGTRRAGVVVRASGGGLAEPLSTTTSSTGAFTFSGLLAVSTYRLEVEQPSGARSGVVVDHIPPTPDSASTVDVDLRSASAAPAAETTTKLPGTGADLFGPYVTDPATGTTFVQKGSELLAIDDDGDVVGRVQDLGSPKGIATGDGAVFVASTLAGPGTRITRIDPVTFAVTGGWTVAATDIADIAFAGHDLFVLTEAVGGFDVRTLDLSTGAVAAVPGAPARATDLSTVGGDANRLVVTTDVGLVVLDVGGAAATTLGQVDGPRGAVAADASTDRLWSAAGIEYQLSTLTPTGRDFGVQGVPVHSPAHGGIVAFGSVVASVATGGPAHTLGTSPTSALAPSGDLAFTRSSTGDLAVHDLTPHVTGATLPNPLFSTGAEVRLTGRGLLATTAARVDGASVPFVVRSDTTVDVAVPAIPVGAHQVTLTTPWGTTESTPIAVVEAPEPSTVATASPATVVGGQMVTLTGTHFTWATAIHVGDQVVTSFTIVDDTTIRFLAPPHAAGAVAISVDNRVWVGPPGASVTYVTPVPTVTSVAPTTGVPEGGGTMTVRGTGFESTTAVTFDGTPALQFQVLSPTHIRVWYPPHAPGAVQVRVTTVGGTTAAGAASTFTYAVPAPSTYRVSPSSGSTLGGTSVTLTGFRFTGATSVRFGTTAATSFQVVDDQTIVAVAPPRAAAGAVDVIVTTPSGSDVPGPGNRFTYVLPGSLSGVVRSGGAPVAGMWVLVSTPTAPELVTAGVTGADGTFTLGPVPVGGYKVYVMDPVLIFGVPARYLGEWYQASGPGTDLFESASIVSVTAGATTTMAAIDLATP